MSGKAWGQIYFLRFYEWAKMHSGLKNKFANIPRYIAKIIFLAVLLGVSRTCLAGYACSGSVSGTSIDNAGTVWAESIAGMPWLQICNLVVRQNNFDPVICKAMHSQLLAAQLAGKTVTIYFNDARTCSTHPAWENVTNGLYFIAVE